MISRERSAASIFSFALCLGAAVVTPTGGCIVESLKKYNGVACALETDCISDHCIDGVCCDSECSSLCEACTAAKKGTGDDGTCGTISHGLDPDNECNQGACSGTNSCQVDNGALCTSATDCLSQYCQGGHCCDTMCSGVGQACNLGGSIGTCVAQSPTRCTEGVELTDVAVHSTPERPLDVMVGDFNNDGQRDVGIRYWGLTYAVAFGQGNGALGSVSPASDADWISYARNAADANHNGYIDFDEQLVHAFDLWADFTNDGILDRIVSRYLPGSIGIGSMESQSTKYLINVYIGLADGTLTLSNTYTIATLAPNAIGIDETPSLGAADFNGDGNLDLVVAGYYYAKIRFGDGNGSFIDPNISWMHGLDHCLGVHVADVNQDGFADVLASWSDGTTEEYLGQSNGTFSSQSLTLANTQNILLVADITKDGKVDLLLWSGPSVLLVRPGRGDGTFEAGKSFAIGGTPYRGHIADMDDDGRDDVVTANNWAYNVSVGLNRCKQ